jgi:hypothetical protein
MTCIRDIEPPPGLSESQLAEFTVLKRALVNLEEQWLTLHGPDDPRLTKYTRAFDQEFDTRIKQAEIIEELDVECVEKQYQEEVARISREFEDAQKHLFKRVIRGYYVTYQKILGHLRDLLGSDFDAFQGMHEIEFPQIPSVKSQERKVPQPEESKIAYSPHETDKLLRRIRQSVQMSIAASEDEDGTSE